MGRWIVTTILAAVLAALLTGCGGSGGAGVGIREGNVAPSFSALSLDGKAVTLQDLAGKPTVLVFWASWCGPCRAEIPHVNEVTEAYGETVNVMGINLGEDPTTAKSVAGSMKYPSLLDPQSSIGASYRVSSIPLVVILDGEGRIRYRGTGLPRDPHTLLDGLIGDS